MSVSTLSTDQINEAFLSLPPSQRADFADALAEEFLKSASSDELIAELEGGAAPAWPANYVNRDTGKVYAPHSEDEERFVYSDVPRYSLCKGGEGCIAAETLVGGVPIAELNQPSQVRTVFGRGIAGAGFRKGRASLYRVRTQSGSEVVVTSHHRFLTPLGWRPLQSLSVGDAVASDGTWNGGVDFRTTSSSMGRCSRGPHPSDELPSPVELVVLDILLQLHRIAFGSNASVPPFPFHFYRTRSFFRVELIRRLIESLLRGLSAAYVSSRWVTRGCGRSPHTFRRLDNALPVHPSGDRICRDGCGGTQLRTHLTIPSSHTQVGCRISQRFLPCSIPHSIGAILPDGRTCVALSHALSLLPETGEFGSRLIERFESTHRLSLGFPILDICLPQGGGQCSSSHPYYNTYWTEIQSIAFVKDGEFYDLHVPCWNHYSAHGLWHHNSGKSVAGIVKMLNRIRRRCDGLMLSPTLPHFKISLWKEARRWIPWDLVVPKHQDRQKEEWEPYGPFTIVFTNGATLECRGIDNEGSCEGPNVNFVFFDEARHKPTPLALKVLDGRVRIPVADPDTGEMIPPQMWLTTTPRKHWLYDYFGPLQVTCLDCGDTEPIAIQEGHPFQCVACGSPNLLIDDEYGDFKHDSLVITLSTRDNEGNVQEGYAAKRAQTLTEAEARVLLDAQWEDIEEGQPFLPHISWWDDCLEPLPPLGERDALVLGVDAATGRTSGESDCFAIVGVTRHPDPARRGDSVAVRYVKTWQAPKGGKIDYRGTPTRPGPERELLRLCGWALDGDDNYVKLPKKPYNVRCIAYDPTQLHDLGMRFHRKRVTWMKEFGQMNMRVMSDTDLLMLIQERRIAHSGDSTLRQHVYNADRKLTEDGKRLRIVKRSDAHKVDAAVALSMAAYWCLYLQLRGKGK